MNKPTDDLLTEMPESADESSKSPPSWLDGPRKANALAVVVSLIFVAGAILIGIYGPTITQVARMNTATPLTEAGAYALQEHEYTMHGEQDPTNASLIRSSSAAESAVSSHLGRRVPVPDLHGIGYDFESAIVSAVPADGAPSAQLRYRRGDGASSVSVFLVPAEVAYERTDQQGRPIPLDAGELVVLTLESTMFPGMNRPVYAWRDDTLIFLMCADEPSDVATIVRSIAPALQDKADALNR